MNYTAIKELIKGQREIKINDLLVMAPCNDPFFSGAPAEVINARWLLDCLEEFGDSSHLRGLHYKFMSSGVMKPDGEPYTNTKNNWAFLTNAAKHARYLGYIDAEKYEDRRNPDPVICADYSSYSYDPEYEFNYDENIILPPAPVIGETDIDINGYSDNDNLLKYHVEIWIEKTTMNSIIKPIARNYKCVFVTGAGYMSITAVIAMLRRAERAGKPTRLFYISDFDPAGDNMPVQVARQCEFWNKKLGINADIKIKAIALNREQVLKFNLPTVPTTSDDKRVQSKTDNWQERRDIDGAVELDALEALHPGELKKIIETELEPYRDLQYEKKLSMIYEEQYSKISYYLNEVYSEYKDELSEIRQEVKRIYDEITEKLLPLQERADEIREIIREEMERDFELPDRPEPDVIEDDSNDDWLFDSSRDYLEQLAVYKSKKIA